MFHLSRAASLALAAFTASLLMGTTTAGTAHEVDRPSVDLINVPTTPVVPVTPPATPIVPIAPVDVKSLAQTDAAVAVTEEEEYATLKDAVAAQSSDIDDAELRCLAAGVFYESHGEPLAGQLAVAQTIVNRTQSTKFPKSVCSVVKQPGQFSFVRGGVVPTAEGRTGWATAVAVAKVALRDLWAGSADKALYFHARHVSPGWRGAQRVASIGNHIFYR